MRAHHVALRAVLLAFALLVRGAIAGEVSLAPLPEAEVQKIFAVAREKAAAAPKKPRKVLVFWRTPGFKHTVIPCTNAAIEVLGRKTGAYQTVTSDDPAMFEPAKLAEFDAVVMNNTCGKNVKIAGRELVREIFLTAEDMAKLTADEQRAALERDARLKKSFEEFVRSGKGLVGFHGATGAFHSWPAFGEMLGAYFRWHPAPQKVRIKLDDPAHPLLAAFGGKGFEMKEEAYVVGDPYSRDTVRVLLTLETTEIMAKNPRKDGDYALAWIRKYGEGRTFYCAFSHFDENFLNPALLRFYLDGLQFALGDLEADATPSAKRQPK